MNTMDEQIERLLERYTLEEILEVMGVDHKELIFRLVNDYDFELPEADFV
jgi:uncharacterized protein YidB (DUF937 family)